jgi:hypothetical protein
MKKMGYNLQNDFDYVSNTLLTMASVVGVDINNLSDVTLNDLMEACANTFGSAEHNQDSPIASAQYAELRRYQASFKRFWYMYSVLNWRINNA